jgi:alanyl-tRNA synthetase
MENIVLRTTESDMEEAVESGAMALFGEKYGEKVRVVDIASFSRELCGGTHTESTGEIGIFRIRSEGSVASGIRRIEAVTGRAALESVRREHEELRDIGTMLKSPDNPSERVRGLLDEMKVLQREHEKLKGAALKDVSSNLLEKAAQVDGVKVIADKVEGLDQKDLRGLADKVRDRLGTGVIVLASVFEGQATLVAMVTKDLTKRFSAGRILKAVADRAGGRGGGKPDMAQGGTKELEKLDSALQSVYDIVKEL